MTIEILQKEKISAMKSGNHFRKDTITAMIDAVQKASITSKGRIEITEQTVNDALIKHQKSIQEQFETCPDARIELKARYKNELNIVKEFTPQLITDESKIKEFIVTNLSTSGIQLTKKNRGFIMKIIAPIAKGKMDMKVVNKVIEEMLA